MGLKTSLKKLLGQWDTPLADFAGDALVALEAWHKERSKHPRIGVKYRDHHGWSISEASDENKIQDLNKAEQYLYERTTDYLDRKRYLEGDSEINI